MLRRTEGMGLLTVWIVFIGLVTGLDWLGLFSSFFAALPLWLGRGAFFLVVVVLLVGLRVVLRSAHRAQIQRTALALGIAWLLVLPFIPWTAEKTLIIRYALLAPGMTEMKVQAIMGTPPGYPPRSVFCDDPEDDKNGECLGTYVIVKMADGRLISAEIEMD